MCTLRYRATFNEGNAVATQRYRLCYNPQTTANFVSTCSHRKTFPSLWKGNWRTWDVQNFTQSYKILVVCVLLLCICIWACVKCWGLFVCMWSWKILHWYRVNTCADGNGVCLGYRLRWWIEKIIVYFDFLKFIWQNVIYAVLVFLILFSEIKETVIREQPFAIPIHLITECHPIGFEFRIYRQGKYTSTWIFKGNRCTWFVPFGLGCRMLII